MDTGATRGVPTPSDYTVPVTWFAGRDGAPVIVMMAALGLAGRFYTRLCERLAQEGFNVSLVEQRGHGESELRPSRHSERAKPERARQSSGRV